VLTPRVFNHVGLTVSSLEQSLAFYELLGFERAEPQGLELSQRWFGELNGVDSFHARTSFASLGATRLQLVEVISPRGASSGPLEPNKIGSVHIALTVDDVHVEHQRLHAAGVTFVSDPFTVQDGLLAGRSIVFAVDPDGHRIELLSGD
jgi:catechol 2,3-dioxygenase-like lactoylglutathione lyase family enzyme